MVGRQGAVVHELHSNASQIRTFLVHNSQYFTPPNVPKETKTLTANDTAPLFMNTQIIEYQFAINLKMNTKF